MGVQTAYILLGGNLGNVPGCFAAARRAIARRIGSISRASALYTSPAWGFEAPEPFYNQALEIQTDLDPFALLRALLSIEKALGRERKGGGDTRERVYTSRTIDLDILFYSGAVISSRELILPHPHIPQRAFTLVPLCEIAPDLVHPVCGQTVRQLLEACPDDIAAVKRCTPPALAFPDAASPLAPAPAPPADLRFLCIEGNIGAGKTSLSKKISAQFGAKLVLERFEDNAFLPKFYEDRDRYAFPLELGFLAERYRQAKEDFVQELFSPFLVSDFSISKCLIFAQNNLRSDEYALFARLFNIILTTLPKPDRYVYLHSDIDRLMGNIRLRARSYEQNMDPEYLRQIQEGYLAYLKTLDPEKTVIIDVTDMDFINRESDYLAILSHIGLI